MTKAAAGNQLEREEKERDPLDQGTASERKGEIERNRLRGRTNPRHEERLEGREN